MARRIDKSKYPRATITSASPLTFAALAAIVAGIHPLESKSGGLALDFIRANLAQPWEFMPLPISVTGPDNDLNDKIEPYVQRAMADEYARIYAFGDTWDRKPRRMPISVAIFMHEHPDASPSDFEIRFLTEGRDWTADYFTPGDRNARVVRRIYFSGS